MSSDQAEMDKDTVNEAVNNVLSVQQDSIALLQESETIDEIIQVAELINKQNGRVIFTGIGKSGDVGQKIASTFNSIGVSSNFVHPVEALHGEFGTLSKDSIVVLISNSGNTDEMVELLQFLRSFDVRTVAITSDPGSKLGRQTDYHLNTKIKNEGAVVDLVPMASTTVTMVIGDCIANALMACRDFSREEYGHIHPGGTIGKRLLLTVEDLLYEEVPKTQPSDKLAQVAVKVGEGGKGIAVIQDENSHVLGILTDGDIRRLFEDDVDFHSITAQDVMITNPIKITPETSAVRAVEIMEEKNITQLVVVDGDDQFEGVIHVHDIMHAGLGTQQST